MKRNRIFTSILAIAFVLIAVIIIVITFGLFRTSKEETLEDHRLSSLFQSAVACVGDKSKGRRLCS